jgi:hypothetical protein
MIKMLTMTLPLVLFSSACAEKPEPQPDPEALEKFLYSEEQSSNENSARTERLIAAVEKAPLERVDPKVALALVE